MTGKTETYILVNLIQSDPSFYKIKKQIIKILINSSQASRSSEVLRQITSPIVTGPNRVMNNEEFTDEINIQEFMNVAKINFNDYKVLEIIFDGSGTNTIKPIPNKYHPFASPIYVFKKK